MNEEHSIPESFKLVSMAIKDAPTQKYQRHESHGVIQTIYVYGCLLVDDVPVANAVVYTDGAAANTDGYGNFELVTKIGANLKVKLFGRWHEIPAEAMIGYPNWNIRESGECYVAAEGSGPVQRAG